MHNPIEHFELHTIIPIHILGFDVSVNLAVIMMWIITVLIITFFFAAMRKRSLIPGRLQSVAEILVDFLYTMAAENIGQKEARTFFPYIATLFMFMFFSNVSGLVPGSHTITSQIMVTGFFAMLTFTISIVVGFIYHGLGFFRVIIPPGVPMALYPLIIPIEIISFFSKPFSLGVRLFANMTAGHTVLLVFFGMVVSLPVFAAWIPFVFSIVIYCLEVFIAIVQAYIFTILSCVYIGDAKNMHH